MQAPKNKKASCYAALKKEILTMSFQPGQDLDEASLSHEHKLSRTPLREVFRELAGEGYLELRENRGARVSEMSHTTLRAFFIAAPMIYGAVMQLAAQNATTTQITALEKAQEDFKLALRKGSVAKRALANNQFHEITGQMADNIYLLPSFNRLLIDHARISMTFYRPQDAQMSTNLNKASQQHDAIIAAIKEADVDTIGQLAIEHWNLSRDQIELFVMPSGLDIPLGKIADEIA